MAWYDEVRHLPWSISDNLLLDSNGDTVAVFDGDTNPVERKLLALAPQLYAACLRALNDDDDQPLPIETREKLLVLANALGWHP